MAKSKSAAPRVTKRDIERYLSLGEERKELDRRSKAIKAQQDEIGAKLFEFARVNGGKARSVLRSGYVLAVKTARGAVSWKNEFVRVAGEDAAEALIAAAPQKESLSVQPAK